MGNIGLILMVFAFVFFVIAAKWNPPGWYFVAIGLACWVLAEIIGGASHVFLGH
jgi:hypothetical protein